MFQIKYSKQTVNQNKPGTIIIIGADPGIFKRRGCAVEKFYIEKNVNLGGKKKEKRGGRALIHKAPPPP